MSDVLSTFLALASPFVFLALFWGAIVWLVGIGWRRITRDYPGREWPRDGHDALRQNVELGVSNYYGSALTFRITDEGLHVRVNFFFRAGHPPLFIPWDEIEEVAYGSLGGREIRMRAGHTLSVSDDLAAAVGRASAEVAREAEPPEAARDGPLAPEETQSLPRPGTPAPR